MCEMPCPFFRVFKMKVIFMGADNKKIIEDSKAEAARVINETADLRKEFAVGRPNSSQESTVEGTLEAFSNIVNDFNPGYTLCQD